MSTQGTPGYFASRKSDAADCIMSFIKEMENLNEVRVKELRSDNGTEFSSSKYTSWKNYVDEKGFYISEFYTSPITTDQNGPLGKFDEKTDDGFFMGYSQWPNAIRTTVFYVANDHPALIKLNQPELADNLKPTEIQDNVIMEPISDVQPTPILSPSAEGILQPPVPQDRWSREKHIELANIIGEPLAGIITRSKVKDSETASAHECLYVNFLSEMEPKKLIEALEE
ncbi:hypothetical protein Tco_0250873 [Tanacetum coccineum]